MSDLILSLATRARIARHSFTRTAVETFVSSAQKAHRRFAREQTGQDMVEYAGVLLVVGIIIAAVVASPVGAMVSDAVSSLVNDITTGSCPKGGKC
ncbi:MAG: hypothetical protein JO156_12125 [Solirubrobacterales bacterium]|nr:hypothetical protein [Solirubrobacterales bacterium]